MLRARACGLAWLTLACGSPLAEARTSFDEARYPDAVTQYRALGARLGELDQAELYEYALYRGLSHLALGDAVPAERWLLFSKRLAERTPGLASSEEQGRLMAAWRSMGHMPGE
ncbi:MAG TPA: hypothetical protein VIW29_00040 [Polyangiaceae bacterium]